MIPDVYTVARYYSDYFSMGRVYGNFLSYGCFNDYWDLGTLYVKPLVFANGKIRNFDPAGITEEIDYSWYTGRVDVCRPLETIPDADMNKEAAYSWIKAPRYGDRPFEVGPLARQWLSGEYRNGISTMDRTIARVLEARKISEVMDVLLHNLIPGVSVQEVYRIPETAVGAALVDTTRGTLGHWLKIDKGVISFYQVITPSAWNLSSRGNNGLRGTAEQALTGMMIRDEAYDGRWSRRQCGGVADAHKYRLHS